MTLCLRIKTQDVRISAATKHWAVTKFNFIPLYCCKARIFFCHQRLPLYVKNVILSILFVREGAAIKSIDEDTTAMPIHIQTVVEADQFSNYTIS